MEQAGSKQGAGREQAGSRQGACKEQGAKRVQVWSKLGAGNGQWAMMGHACISLDIFPPDIWIVTTAGQTIATESWDMHV